MWYMTNLRINGKTSGEIAAFLRKQREEDSMSEQRNMNSTMNDARKQFELLLEEIEEVKKKQQQDKLTAELVNREYQMHLKDLEKTEEKLKSLEAQREDNITKLNNDLKNRCADFESAVNSAWSDMASSPKVEGPSPEVAKMFFANLGIFVDYFRGGYTLHHSESSETLNEELSKVWNEIKSTISDITDGMDNLAKSGQEVPKGSEERIKQIVQEGRAAMEASRSKCEQCNGCDGMNMVGDFLSMEEVDALLKSADPLYQEPKPKVTGTQAEGLHCTSCQGIPEQHRASEEYIRDVISRSYPFGKFSIIPVTWGKYKEKESDWETKHQEILESILDAGGVIGENVLVPGKHYQVLASKYNELKMELMIRNQQMGLLKLHFPGVYKNIMGQ